MYSIGIDSIEIERIIKSICKPAFIEKVFGKSEQAELELKKWPPQSAAACFAGKEAFSKAIGTGIAGFELNEVQVIHNEKGKPILLLSGKAKAIAEEMKLSFDISITHTDTVATAAVIAFKNE